MRKLSNVEFKVKKPHPFPVIFWKSNEKIHLFKSGFFVGIFTFLHKKPGGR